MFPLLHSISLVSAAMVDSLVSAIWEGAVLAVCVALCLRFLPELGATVRSIVWTNTFLLLVLMHILPTLDAQQLTVLRFHGSPLHLDPLWSLAIGSLWLMLSFWRGAQLIS